MMTPPETIPNSLFDGARHPILRVRQGNPEPSPLHPLPLYTHPEVPMRLANFAQLTFSVSFDTFYTQDATTFALTLRSKHR
jgi:hypothetical protein